MAVPTNETDTTVETADPAVKTGEATSVVPARRGGVPPRPGRSASLKTERGITSIADTVVEKVAGIATREVRGVYDMGGGTTRAIGAVTQRVGLADERSQGVSVEVGERETAIDLTVVIEYGESIPQVADQIRENVITRIEGITGLSVTEVNVAVNDLHFEGDNESSTRVS
jgi:uncharacterized alkaline shock family protein YloU